jgi:DNA-binding PadR family transcriptional regulator
MGVFQMPNPPSTELRPISYAVIALVGRGGASSPELVEMAERGGAFFWTGAASQVYAEARRLARLGYLVSSTEPSKTRPRTTYRLTERGLEAFRAWAHTPAPYPRIQHEASLRVFALDLLEDPLEVLPGFDALEQRLDVLEREVDELERRAETIPHRILGIGLQLSLARGILAAHRTWIAEVRTALASASEPGSSPSLEGSGRQMVGS